MTVDLIIFTLGIPYIVILSHADLLWLMVVSISQLTLYPQVKCEQYWPDQLNATNTIGSNFTVTLTSFVPSAEYQVRKLVVKSVS